MFKILKKVERCQVYAPVNGMCFPIEKVSDIIFASKMMGEGCAFSIEDDIVYAPCDGKLIVIAETKHAFGIKANNGAEILVHIGLDTVNLNGNGFKLLKKLNSRIKAHDPIIQIDRDYMKQKNIDLIIPMVVTNMNEYDINRYDYGAVTIDQIAFEVMKK